MNPEILRRLDALAERLNSVGSQAWQELVRYQSVCSWTAMVSGVAFSIGMLILTVYLIRWGKKIGGEGSMPCFFFSIITAGGAAGLLVMALVSLPAILCPAGRILMKVLQ